MGGREERQTVERRIRLDAGLATRLSVAAAVRGLTESRFVELAIAPHLRFDLPELPDVVTLADPGTGNGIRK